ncbi:MAG: hypothetical protein ACRED9_14400 [Caulobacteraceae bacterium]
MRNQLLLSGLALAILLPGVVAAQETCQQHRTNEKVVGTVVGAGLGALFGNAVASHGGKPGGTIIGGVAGGVAGNAIAGSGTHCYGQGYYDRDGRWRAASNAGGYYDSQGHWIAYGAGGYYDNDGRWVASGPGGSYDRDGHWVAYGSQGYYDRYGHWVPTAPYASGVNAAYTDRGMWGGAPFDTQARESWLVGHIRDAREDGRLDHYRADNALRQLYAIQRQDQRYRDDNGGALSTRERNYIQARLDDLRRGLTLY